MTSSLFGVLNKSDIVVVVVSYINNRTLQKNKWKLVMVGCSKFFSATAALTGPTSCTASVKGMLGEIGDLLCCFPLLCKGWVWI